MSLTNDSHFTASHQRVPNYSKQFLTDLATLLYVMERGQTPFQESIVTKSIRLIRVNTSWQTGHPSASMSYFLFFLFHVNFMKHLCVSHRARSIQEIIQKWSTSEEQQYFLFNPVENSLSSEFLPCLQLTESGV